MERLEILKTYKIYIGGKFPRTESGRTVLVKDSNGKPYANICQSSRKDLREAVVTARSAFGGWSARAAFNRGQILYRIGEMLEGRKSQFVEEMMALGTSKENALKEVEQAIDRTIYYSGWCDKYQQIFSSVNPVASSHFNFSVQEPMGVVVIVCGNNSSLLNIVSMVMPVIAGGNSCIVLAPEKNPLCAVTFAEVINSSDVPGGVVNILTGFKSELIEHISNHLDINAVFGEELSNEEVKLLEDKSTSNLKRTLVVNSDWMDTSNQNPYTLLNFQETKTTWHPIESIGGAGGGY